MYHQGGLDDAALLALVKKQATIYHDDKWLDALCHFYGYKKFTRSISDGNSVAISRLVRVRRLGFLSEKVISAPASMYAFPLFTDFNALSLLVGEILNETSNRNIDLSMKLPVSEYNGLYLYSREIDSRVNILPYNESWSALRGSARRAIRKAINKKLDVEFGTFDQLNDFFGLLFETKKRLGLPLTPLSWLRKILSLGCAGIVMVYKENKPVAGIFFLFDENNIHYSLPAYSDEGARCSAMDLAIWELIGHGRDLGVAVLCLGGSSVDNAGLIRFKSKWNAVESEWGLYTSCKPRVLNKKDAAFTRLIPFVPREASQLISYCYLRFLV